MDEGMPGCLRGFTEAHGNIVGLIQTFGRRRFVHLFGNVYSCTKCSIGTWGDNDSDASLLRQSAVHWSWKELSEAGNFTYCLLIASRKLRSYFQAHTIKVLTNLWSKYCIDPKLWEGYWSGALNQACTTSLIIQGGDKRTSVGGFHHWVFCLGLRRGRWCGHTFSVENVCG